MVRRYRKQDMQCKDRIMRLQDETAAMRAIKPLVPLSVSSQGMLRRENLCNFMAHLPRQNQYVPFSSDILQNTGHNETILRKGVDLNFNMALLVSFFGILNAALVEQKTKCIKPGKCWYRDFPTLKGHTESGVPSRMYLKSVHVENCRSWILHSNIIT
jgi:hypothetical protein